MKNALIKAKNESNSLLLASFLTQSGAFYNLLTRSMGCAKISYSVKQMVFAQCLLPIHKDLKNHSRFFVRI